MNPNPRYEGRPLVRLLECYVLWAIGELSEREAATLADMTPKLQSLYGSSSPWQEIVASTVRMDDSAAEGIRELWARNMGADSPLPAQQFAEVVVDRNFIGEEGA